MGNRAAARVCRQRRGLGRAIPGRRAGRRRDLRRGSGLSRAGRNKRRTERGGVQDRDRRNAEAYGTGACGTRRHAGQGRTERVGVQGRDRRNAEACGTGTGGTRRRTGQGRAERGGVRGKVGRNTAGAVRQCRGRRVGLCAVTARRGRTGRGCRESPAANPPGRRRGSCRTARAAPR